MFGNPFERRDDLKSENKSAPDPFGRLGEDDEPDTEIAEIKNPTKLASSVGDSGQNSRRDVAKTEQLLGEVGTLDLKKTDGPTGYWGTRTSDATKTFQKQNDLKVDGQINPGGETIRALGKLAGQAVKAAQSSNTQSAPAKFFNSKSSDDQTSTTRVKNRFVIPAKAGTQLTDSPVWVPDQVRDDKGGEGSNALKLTDEAFSENTRAARYLASRDGIGEFSKFVADGIETDGDKAIAETVDLYRQTAEMHQGQADALIKKVIPGLSSENAQRLQSAIMPGEHDQVDDALGLKTARMDEDGTWFDAMGNPRSNPNADPRILKAAVPSVPVPGIPTVPGGIHPASPEDIDKALDNASKDVRKAWDALKDATGISDADLYQTPLGQMILMGKALQKGLGKVMDGDKRTDIAEPQPNIPGFPSVPSVDLLNHTKGHSTEPDRVIDPPGFVPPPKGAETSNSPFPDQSDDPDINGATLLDIGAPGPRDFILTKEDKLDFGEIPTDVEKATGGRFPAKPIRVQRGEPGIDKWGFRHVVTDPHKPQRIRDLGYETELDMIEDISSGYEEIYQQENGSLLLVKANGKNRYGVVRLQNALEGEFYGATTWFPDGKGSPGDYLNGLVKKGRAKKIWP